jgi:hypothetical protein
MTTISLEDISDALNSSIGKLIDEKRIVLLDDVEEGYTVYLLQILDDVWQCKKCSKQLGAGFAGASAFYVGTTNRTREERIADHVKSNLDHSKGISTKRSDTNYWTRGAKMTRHHDFIPLDEIELVAPDRELLEGRLKKDDAKLLEQIVIPTALRALGIAAYAGATEEFVVLKKSRAK